MFQILGNLLHSVVTVVIPITDPTRGRAMLILEEIIEIILSDFLVILIFDIVTPMY